MDTYEKKYKEALERAKEQLERAKVFDYKEGQIAHDIRTTTYAIFPELAESADERIRKEMLSVIKQFDDDSSLCGKKYNYRKWIAWLEKQKPINISIEDKRIRKSLINYVQCHGAAGDFTKEEFISWLEKQESVGEIVERCKTSWYNEGKIQGQIEGLSDEEKYQQGWHDALEKQGGIDNCPLEYSTNTVMTDSKKNQVEPKFKVGDTIIKKQNSDINKFGQFTITDITGGKYWYNDRIICDISEQYEWELVEQKPISFDTSTPVSYDDIPFGVKDYGLHGATYFTPEGFNAETEGDKVIIKRGEKSPTWSEDDVEMFEQIEESLDYYRTKVMCDKDYALADIVSKEITWIKTLKDRIGG